MESFYRLAYQVEHGLLKANEDAARAALRKARRETAEFVARRKEEKKALLLAKAARKKARHSTATTATETEGTPK